MKLDRLRDTKTLGLGTFEFLIGPAYRETRPFERLSVETTKASRYSSILDWSGPLVRNRHGYPHVGPVDHFRLKGRFPYGLSRWIHRYGPEPFETQEVLPVSRWVPLHWDFLLSLRNVRPPDSLIRDCGLDAYKEFNTQFPEKVKFPNFLWELRAIGDLIPRLQSSLSKTIAGGYLTLEFGWKPFLGDLQELGRLSESVRSRLKALLDTYGRVTRLGYMRPNAWSYNPPSERLYVDKSRGLSIEYVIRDWSTDIRVGARLYHELEYIKTVEGQLRGFAGSLGLTNPAAVIWESLPFSFVVDWFLNISGYLDAYANLQDRSVVWDVTDVTHSTKSSFVIDVFQVNEESGLRKWVGDFDGSHYRRSLGFPTPQSMFPVGSLTPHQLTLLGALLLG